MPNISPIKARITEPVIFPLASPEKEKRTFRGFSRFVFILHFLSAVFRYGSCFSDM